MYSAMDYTGYGRALDIPMIKTINSWAMNNRQPDITVYLRIDIDTAYQRIKQRNNGISTFEQHRSFLQRIIDGFDALYADRTDVIRIDGTQQPDIVVQQACNALMKHLEPLIER